MSLQPGTDTYADLVTLTGILSDHGFGQYLDQTDTLALEAHARLGTLYLDHAWRFVGQRSSADQVLQWPRIGAFDQSGQPIASDAIPPEIILGEAFLMQAASAGPLAGETGGAGNQIVARETADDAVIEFERGSHRRRFVMVSAIIRHLTIGQLMGGFAQVMAVRG